MACIWMRPIRGRSGKGWCQWSSRHSGYEPVRNPASVSPRTADDQLFDHYYSQTAKDIGAGYFNAALVATASPIVGVHLDAANTRAIGAGLIPLVKSMLGL